MSDPAIHQLVAALRAGAEAMTPPPFEDRAAFQAYVDAARVQFDTEHGAIPVAEGVTVKPLDLPGLTGELLVPAGAPANKAILYHHGGGYLFGSSISHRHLVSRLAKVAGVVAYNMDYPLAPEHLYPTQLNTALVHYRALLDKGLQGADIVLAGDSAGANLTTALLLKIKEQGLPMPAGAFLISPLLDLTMSGESHAAMAKIDPWATPPLVAACIRAFIGDHRRDDPILSPIRADLKGLPPLLIHVGTCELILSDSTTLATRAALAGVDVRLDVWQDMIHGWHLFHPLLTEDGPAAIRDAGQWMAEQLKVNPAA